MKVKSLLGLCLMSVAVCVTPLASIVQATEANDSSKNAVEEATDSEEKVDIDDDVLNKNKQATVVTGADGLLYVVASDEDDSTLLTDKDDLENNSLLQKATETEDQAHAGSVEVAVDEKRQEKADSMDTGVKTFDDVDMENVEDLQSALNDEDFPFLEGSELDEALENAESTNESDEVFAQSRYFFALQIVEQTQNFNDVPTVAKSRAVALAATTSGTVSETRINPPNGYGWVIYMTLKNGTSYTENYMIRRTINGKTAFCIEPGVSSTKNYTTSGTSPLTATQVRNISAIISAYEYDGGWTANNATNIARFIAAQMLVWENTSNNPRSITVTPNYASATSTAKTRINNIANNLKSTPTYDKTSTTVNKGDKATFTVKSNNYKLSIAGATNGGSASISGNTITVNTSGVTPGNTVTVTVRKGATASESNGNSTAVWQNGSWQRLVTGRFFTNTTLTVKVRDTGTVEVVKTDKDTNARLSGATFRFTYNGSTKDVVTNSNGVANLGVQLNPGTVVKVRETKAPAGYKLDGTEFSMTVAEGKTVSTTRTNIKETGTLKILKTGDLDGKPLEGVTFSIFKSDGTTAFKTGLKTDSAGSIVVKDVPFGDYYVKETAGVSGYEPDGKSYKVTVSAASTDDKPATITITNTYNVSVSKTVSDKDVSNKTSNTWSAASDQFLRYDLTSSTLRKSGKNYVTSFVLTDNIDMSKVDITNVQVFTGTTDVTSSFDITKTDAGVVTAKAKAASLTTDGFYDKAYTLRTSMKLKPAVTSADQSTKATFSITRKGSVSVGSSITKSAESNDVVTTLPAFTVTDAHMLARSELVNSVITTMNKNSNKYYRGESYKVAKMPDGKYKYNNVIYYYNFIPSLGEASYAGTVSKDETFNFYYTGVALDNPTKSITDKDESNVTSNTIDYNEKFTYKVNHNIPEVLATANLDSYVMTDAIDSKLSIVSKRVLDSNGKDVTSLFTDKTSGNNVRYEATATALKTASFYGQTYTFEISVKVADSALQSDSSKKTQLTFTNKATVIPDNVSKTTNTVTSVLPVYTLTSNHTLLKTTTKSDVIGSIKTNTDKYYRGQSYKYDKLADGKVTLNNVLYYYNFIPTLGNASYSGTATKNETFNFYYVSILVKDPTKTVTDKDETNVTNNTLLFDETFTYNVKHEVPKQLATVNFASYVMTDTVDSKLTIVSKRVLDSSGKDVTSLFTDKTSGNNVRYEAKADTLKSASFYGQTYTYEIKAKVADSALVSDKSAKTQLSFSNKATITPDNVSKTSNTVTSILPVYTLKANHTLLKTANTSDMIGSMRSVTEKYYRGESYKYDKMADGRITLNNVLYYYNFIPTLGNASYSGTVLKDDTFNFYYLSIVVNTPDKKVTDSDETDVTSNTITAYETYTYNVRHSLQKELGTAQFGTYSISDAIDSKLTIVSTRILNGSGKDVTSLFDNKTSGNNVRYDAKAASLKDASFYGQTYNLEIKVRISDATLNANGATKRTITINNVGTVTPDGVVKNTPKVETTLPAYKVTINHIDVKTKNQLAQDIDYKYDGEKYTYNPRTDLFDGEGNNYKSFVVHTGTIEGKDIVLETPYHIPVFTVNIDKIQIDTAKASASTPLPVVMTLSDYREYEDELGNIVYRIKAVDTTNSNKVVYNKEFKVADYTDTLKFSLPTDYLTKDKKVNYTFSVELVANPDKNDFNTESGSVKTHGYTASEKVLTNSDLVDGKIDYSAVLRTIKERNVTAIKEYNERVHYDFVTEERSKTGYGFELGLEPAYENELNNSVDIKMSVVSPTSLVDDYINQQYKASGDTTAIPLEKTDSTTDSEDGVRKQTYVYEMPHVNVERGSGALFTDEQVSTGYSKIQNDVIDGGNKFYLPIWADLGDYDIFLSSDSTFGQNLIKINMHKDLDVYAYMYGTIGSDTINRDELVVQPVYADESYEDQLPKDWTDAEKDWVKDN